MGSGIIFEAAEGGTGLVLTNYHVVEDSYRIDVLVDDSRTFRANVVGFDQRRDLAVLEMCCDEFAALELSATAGISAGSEVVAIGYALGLTGNATVTRGIVSAVRYHTGMRAWVIQTDASINPGNSGGPPAAAHGRSHWHHYLSPEPGQPGQPHRWAGFCHIGAEYPGPAARPEERRQECFCGDRAQQEQPCPARPWSGRPTPVRTTTTPWRFRRRGAVTTATGTGSTLTVPTGSPA